MVSASSQFYSIFSTTIKKKRFQKTRSLWYHNIYLLKRSLWTSWTIDWTIIHPDNLRKRKRKIYINENPTTGSEIDVNTRNAQVQFLYHTKQFNDHSGNNTIMRVSELVINTSHFQQPDNFIRKSIVQSASITCL